MDFRLTRREALKLGVGLAAAAGLTLGPRRAGAQKAAPLNTRPIPSSGEKLPVIGLGTNRYGVTEEAAAARRAVLKLLPSFGGAVVDTAPGYGRSEEVIGQLVALGNRDKLWLATKVTAADGDTAGGRKMLEESFKRLKAKRLEFVQVHNLSGVSTLLPILRELKQAGRIRYLGVTTSRDEQYDALLAIMRKETLDFIQVDYSVGNRGAADKILPLAAERGMAVLVDLPLGGARQSVLARTKDRPLPEWAAAELGAKSFAQLALKYVVSHPAVTVAIPGTTNVAHLEDNLGAARGALPDEALRRRIEGVFEA